MKILKLLFALRSWKNGRSKLLDFGALLALLPVIDASFFGSGIGMKIVGGLYQLLALIPGFPAPTMEQAVSFLVFVIGGVVVWLRALTKTSLEEKVEAVDANK